MTIKCDYELNPSPKDFTRAREIYRAAVKLVPHKQFTFAKLWIMFARFEVRRLDVAAARKILGAAIGMCPKEGLFKGYIQLELEASPSTPFKFYPVLIRYALASFENLIACEHFTKSTSR